MKKETINMRIAVHPIKAALWRKRSEIKPDISLREMGKVIGLKSCSAQQIKHHLDVMVRMGSVDFVGGQYIFPK